MPVGESGSPCRSGADNETLNQGLTRYLEPCDRGRSGAGK